ncbi:transglutaminase [Nocardioides phosphati]|uniref:Transglutaminase n=1 Tax=Nocardioides phosphati TaxID=1867775 RepID=A0ABQ2NEP4_9ACTN|nr:transglutaminase family protein [Nocardioides phosphati]GGO93449.1 transglutaminase [Nocardioides phosphati]
MSHASSPPLDSLDPARCLGDDAVVESRHPAVVMLGESLRAGSDTDAELAERAFTWVRDEVGHSYDVGDPRVTLRASEVLEHRVGLCYAKAHLLAAVLRSQGVPAALAYQRLAHGESHVLHGLVAVHLEGAWHRQDPRGNKQGVDAQFSLGEERLAFAVDPAAGEVDYPTLHVTPAPVVVEVLQSTDDILALYDAGLPTHV